MGRHILFIGIGQTGCGIAEKFSQKMKNSNAEVHSLAVDTDEDILSKVNMSQILPLIHNGNLGYVIDETGEEHIEEWFPCGEKNNCSDFVKSLDMRHGSNQWRMKAMLSFVAFMRQEGRKEKFDAFLSELTGETEIYVSASLAGGTGSALFLPITFYVKKYIEKNGGKVIRTSAALAMPQIFDNVFSSEQKVKAFANAYTAVRELNAINAAMGETIAFPSPIFVSAGLKYSYARLTELSLDRVIFDSENYYSCGVNSKPFDKVYMFERVPGVTSVSAHEDIIAETLATYSRSVAETAQDGGDQTSCAPNLEINAGYSGVSLTKVRYPIESIVEYTAKRQFSEFASNEMCALHIRTENEIKRIMLELRSCGERIGDKFSLYCKLYAEFAEETAAEKESIESIIGRNYFSGNSISDDTDTDMLKGDGFRGVADIIHSPFECEASEYICEAVYEGSFDKGKEPEKKGFGYKKKHFAESVERIDELLCEYYGNSVSELMNGNEEFDEAVYSYIESNVLKDGEAYLHPVYALSRLCNLYCDVNKNISSPYEFIAEKADAQIPTRLLYVKTVNKLKTKYAKAGDTRFVCCMVRIGTDDKGNPESREKAEARRADYVKKTASAEGLLFDDLGYVYGNMRDTFADCRKRRILDILKKIISNYRRLAEHLSDIDEDLQSDIRLCAITAGKDSGCTVNIGASAEKKIKYYSEYIKICKDSALSAEEYDVFVGKTVANLVLRDSDGLSEDELTSVCEVIEKGFADRFVSSDYFKNNVDKNIIEAVTEELGGSLNSLSSKASRIFMGRNVPLSLNMSQIREDRERIKEETCAIIPASLKACVAEMSGGKSPEAYVEGLMFKAGEYRGYACFTEGFSEKEMFIRKEISGLKPYMIESLNESSHEHEGYKAYQKALRVSREQMTYMWDPNISFKRESGCPLAFINPEKQTEYAVSVAKALIAATLENDIFVADLEYKDSVYFIMTDEGREPIVVEYNELIEEKDILLLVSWVYKNPSLVKKYSAVFDGYVSDLRRKYPSFKPDIFNNGKISSDIFDSEFVNGLLDFSANFMKKVTIDNDPMKILSDNRLQTVMQLIGQTMYDFCLCGEDELNETTAAIYNRIADMYGKKLKAACGDEIAEEISMPLNMIGAFMKFDYPTNFYAWAL